MATPTLYSSGCLGVGVLSPGLNQLQFPHSRLHLSNFSSSTINSKPRVSSIRYIFFFSSRIKVNQWNELSVTCFNILWCGHDDELVYNLDFCNSFVIYIYIYIFWGGGGGGGGFWIMSTKSLLFGFILFVFFCLPSVRYRKKFICFKL